VHQAYLLELTPSGPQPNNLNANAIGGNGQGEAAGGGATATANASASKTGIANATATANGGAADPFGPGGGAIANAGAANGGSAVSQATGGNASSGGGAATANASATNGGSAVAQATGGNGFGDIGRVANATATSTALLGGTANATATANGGILTCTGGPPCLIAATNANSFATTINGNMAQALSSAVSVALTPTFHGQAQATAQTNFGNFQSVQSTSTSPVSGSTTAIAQAGGVVSPSNPIIPGQSFSVVSGSGFGPLTVANGSMGAGYGGEVSLTYQVSASFMQLGGAFVLDLLSSNALGIGFDSALFQILLNGAVMDSQSFTDLSSAEKFFSDHLIGVPLSDGSNNVQLQFSETMSSFFGEGFSFDYAVASCCSVSVPGPRRAGRRQSARNLDAR
jgi:hypothetical protein